MRGPKDFEEKLTPEDLKAVEGLERAVETWFDDPKRHAEVSYNTVLDEPRHPRRVWEELIKNARHAGWDAQMHGSTVIIRRPNP